MALKVSPNPPPGVGTRSSGVWRSGGCRVGPRLGLPDNERSPCRWAAKGRTPRAFIAGRSEVSFRAVRTATSSSAPLATIDSRRRSSLALSSVRSGSRTIRDHSCIFGADVSFRHAVSVRPVAAWTSKARVSRWRSLEAMRVSDCGSTAFKRVRKRSSPSSANSAWVAARVSLGIGGMSASPCVSARKYSPVPPTTIAGRPRAAIRASVSRAALSQRPTDHASAASAIPNRWCGAAASSASLGRAVRMRRSR